MVWGVYSFVALSYSRRLDCLHAQLLGRLANFGQFANRQFAAIAAGVGGRAIPDWRVDGAGRRQHFLLVDSSAPKAHWRHWRHCAIAAVALIGALEKITGPGLIL